MKASLSRGRPRSDKAHQAILEAALSQVFETGFRVLTIDAVATRANVGKMTIYRRWPNKAALVMDAFLSIIGPGTEFPEAPGALERVRLQMRLQVKFFRSKVGKMIKALLGEAQFDQELAVAFRERWINPRRRMTMAVLQEAIDQGELRKEIDLETAIDLFYGPLYYRLQIQTGPLNDEYADTLFRHVIRGLGQAA